MCTDPTPIAFTDLQRSYVQVPTGAYHQDINEMFCMLPLEEVIFGVGVMLCFDLLRPVCVRSILTFLGDGPVGYTHDICRGSGCTLIDYDPCSIFDCQRVDL